MNKRQKEIQQMFLDNEKAVLKKLEENYHDALFEINDRIERLLARQDADMQNVIYQVEYQKALKAQVNAIMEQLHSNEFETVSEYLAAAYDDGFIGTMYDLQGQGIPLVIPIDQKQVAIAIQHETKLSDSLYDALGKDTKRLSKQIASEISRGISNAATYDEMTRNIASFSNIPRNNAARIARTEAHRIQNKATADAQWKAKEKGADVLKQWDSTLDGKTRPHHRELDGQIRELDEPFEVAGKKAMQPGDFGDPSEDVNCRCALLQRARWALDNDFTKWDHEAGGLVKIKSKDYDDFKMKYAKESERVRSSAQKINDSKSHNDVKRISKHVIQKNSVVIGGEEYVVDGKHVLADASDIEKKTAEILGEAYKTDVILNPRITFPQHVSSADYDIFDEKYDMKEITGNGKDTLRDAIKKKKSQANNFVFEMTGSEMTIEEIERQIKVIFESGRTRHVKKIVVVKNEKIIKEYTK